MNSISTLDDHSIKKNRMLGEQLANIRKEKGYTVEYVASKLNLRVSTIELLENNEFCSFPAPVFAKGYIRAYSKLLGVSPEPYIALLSELTGLDSERKPEGALLWQQRKPESFKSEFIIRWITLLFALGVIIAVGIWWQKNEDNQKFLAKTSEPTELALNQKPITEISKLNLTDISKLQSLFDPQPERSSLE